MDELKSNILIVGAGVSGLTAASELATLFPTVVIDRLPVIGGINAGYENEFAISLKRLCDERGVRFMLGSTALRWSSDQRLLVVGPSGIEWLPGLHLVYAGGARPSTGAELGILGERLAGVLPATVAHHLLESGVRLGERCVIIGAGNWAVRVGDLLKPMDCHICVIPMDDTSPRPEFAHAWWPGWMPISIHGKERIHEISLKKDGMIEKISCDSLILAAKMKPLRNIDSAIFEKETKAATFAQLASDTSSLEQRSEHARRIAANLLNDLRREST